MAKKETIKEVVVEEVAPVVEEVAQEVAAPKLRAFIAVRNRLWHPHQSVYIEHLPVELVFDSWTECQFQAGIIREVF